jgi:hypothetical protein
MATTHFAGRYPHARRRAASGRLSLPALGILALAIGATGFIASVLWPRWPAPPVATDAPTYPVTVAGVPFNIAPAAMRVKVQRVPGAHDRIDLAFLWPSLKPPDPDARPHRPAPNAPDAPIPPVKEVFVTISAAGDTLAPNERVKAIYPHYAASQAVAAPGGLAILAFREGTPYQGEDLIYDAQRPDAFLVRCTRDGAGPTPGICLYGRRIDAADLVVRFPRDWLADWRSVKSGIERLISSLRPQTR